MASKDNYYQLIEALKKDGFEFMLFTFQKDKDGGYMVDTHANFSDEDILFLTEYTLQDQIKKHINGEEITPPDFENIEDGVEEIDDEESWKRL